MGFSRYLDFRKLKKKNEEVVPEPSPTVGNLFLHYSSFLKKKRYMHAQWKLQLWSFFLCFPRIYSFCGLGRPQVVANRHIPTSLISRTCCTNTKKIFSQEIPHQPLFLQMDSWGCSASLVFSHTIDDASVSSYLFSPSPFVRHT